MDNQTRIANLAEDRYQVLFGVSKTTFDKMLTILTKAYAEMRKRGGRERKLSVLDALTVFISYYHDYRTMENIGFEYGVRKQRICEAVNWVEQTLMKDGSFSLPSKRELVRTCLTSLCQQVNEGQATHLVRSMEFAFAIFPETTEFIKPGICSFHYPSFGNDNKFM